jgi:hypothetical protein
MKDMEKRRLMREKKDQIINGFICQVKEFR